MYSELQVTKQGRNSWELIEDWHTPYGVIPKGFTSNGANVPRIFWWFVHPAGILFEAAVVHDYYYKHALESKAYADNIFRLVAQHHGASRIEATLAHKAVKWIGKGNYK